MTNRDIIIDTDHGHDDALAIMLAVKSDKFNIHAITTVAGNSTIENTTRNARYILRLLQIKEIPVFSGVKKPLKRELIKAVVHGDSGLDGIDPKDPAGLTGNAVEKIIAIIKENPNKVTLITLGPLTNIAKAINKEPSVMKKVKRIVMMGGAIKVAGNKNRVAEFNIFVDPEAADVVFKFPVKKVLVPLDACNHIKLYLNDFEKITNSRIRRPILAMMKPFMENLLKYDGIKGALVYDALAVYYLINPSVCRLENYDILVETEGTKTRGMTVADLRPKPEKKNIISVVEKISEKDFKNDFIRYLNR